VVETARAAGISVELIDLRTLWPWDRETVLGSVARTRRLVIAQEAVQVCGVGAEIAATVAETLGPDLAAPIRRLGAPRIPIAYAPTSSGLPHRRRPGFGRHPTADGWTRALNFFIAAKKPQTSLYDCL